MTGIDGAEKLDELVLVARVHERGPEAELSRGGGHLLEVEHVVAVLRVSGQHGLPHGDALLVHGAVHVYLLEGAVDVRAVRETGGAPGDEVPR